MGLDLKFTCEQSAENETEYPIFAWTRGHAVHNYTDCRSVTVGASLREDPFLISAWRRPILSQVSVFFGSST
jgi:hypothetical protein